VRVAKGPPTSPQAQKDSGFKRAEKGLLGPLQNSHVSNTGFAKPKEAKAPEESKGFFDDTPSGAGEALEAEEGEGGATEEGLKLVAEIKAWYTPKSFSNPDTRNSRIEETAGSALILMPCSSQVTDCCAFGTLTRRR
jgi:hypothetical protein